MNEVNLPPFYVGQRVVALASGRTKLVKKGNIYQVFGIKQCNCGKWLVNVGLKHPMRNTYCFDCLTPISEDYTAWARASLFAPIQENFQSISLSKVLEEETKLISVN